MSFCLTLIIIVFTRSVAHDTSVIRFEFGSDFDAVASEKKYEGMLFLMKNAN